LELCCIHLCLINKYSTMLYHSEGMLREIYSNWELHLIEKISCGMYSITEGSSLLRKV
jgi:hypothetical protein